MDGKGCWMDNIFIERLWRSIKYECIYLQEFDNVYQLRKVIANWLEFYNKNRPHSTLAGLTPEDVYYGDNSNGLMPKNNKFAALKNNNRIYPLHCCSSVQSTRTTSLFVKI